MERTRRKEGPGGLPRGPMRDQEDGEDQKERGTKRIAKGTNEGPGGWRGLEGKRDQEDCQGDQEKRGLMEWVRRKERPKEKRNQEDCQEDQEKRGTRRIPKGTKEGPRGWRGPKGKTERETKRIAKGTSRKEGAGVQRGLEGKRDQEDCQGYQQKRGSRSSERIRREE